MFWVSTFDEGGRGIRRYAFKGEFLGRRREKKPAIATAAIRRNRFPNFEKLESNLSFAGSI
jgi:hypothetical protein